MAKTNDSSVITRGFLKKFWERIKSLLDGKQNAITPGTGLKWNANSNTTLDHTNSVTAKTDYTGSATAALRVKYDAQGHITASTTSTIYPPTTAGTSGQVWKSKGSGVGEWGSFNELTSTKVTDANAAIPTLPATNLTNGIFATFIAGSSASNIPPISANYHILSSIYRTSATNLRLTQIATASGSTVNNSGVTYERNALSSDNGTTWTFGDWKKLLTSSDVESKQDNITPGSGLQWNASSATTLEHSNSITARTSYLGSATSVPRIQIDAQGHITAYTSATIYPPTTAGTSGQIWQSDGSGAGVWQTLDTTPTANSKKAITSGAVETALGGYLPLTGGTVSGDTVFQKTLSGAPVVITPTPSGVSYIGFRNADSTVISQIEQRASITGQSLIATTGEIHSSKYDWLGNYDGSEYTVTETDAICGFTGQGILHIPAMSSNYSIGRVIWVAASSGDISVDFESFYGNFTTIVRKGHGAAFVCAQNRYWFCEDHDIEIAITVDSARPSYQLQANQMLVNKIVFQTGGVCYIPTSCGYEGRRIVIVGADGVRLNQTTSSSSNYRILPRYKNEEFIVEYRNAKWTLVSGGYREVRIDTISSFTLTSDDFVDVINADTASNRTIILPNNVSDIAQQVPDKVTIMAGINNTIDYYFSQMHYRITTTERCFLEFMRTSSGWIPAYGHTGTIVS